MRADRQADRQTCRHVDRSTSLPYWGRCNYYAAYNGPIVQNLCQTTFKTISHCMAYLTRFSAVKRRYVHVTDTCSGTTKDTIRSSALAWTAPRGGYLSATILTFTGRIRWPLRTGKQLNCWLNCITNENDQCFVINLLFWFVYCRLCFNYVVC